MSFVAPRPCEKPTGKEAELAYHLSRIGDADRRRRAASHLPAGRQGRPKAEYHFVRCSKKEVEHDG